MNILIKSAIALSITASQAAALSCAVPDIADGYKLIAASEKTYVVLQGKFSFATRPDRSGEQNPETQSFGSKFTGTYLTENGFTEDVSDVLVTINSNCVASWCGRIMPDVPYIAFVERDGRKLTLQAEACPVFAFAQPSAEAIKTVETCAAGGECIPAN